MQLCCLQTWYRFTDIASAEFRHSPLCCCQNTNFVLLFLHLQSSKGTIEIHYLLLLFVLICSRFFIIIIIIIIVIIIFIFHASGLKPVMVTSAKKTEAESSQCIHSAPLGFKYEMEDEN